MGTGAGQIVNDGDFLGIQRASSGRPAWKLVQQVAQSIPSNTDTAITFGTGSTLIDTDNFHDEVTNNTRVTPTVAGIYVVQGIIAVASDTDVTNLATGFGKNGSLFAPRARHVGPTVHVGNNQTAPFVSTLVEVDGVTDYIQLFGLQLQAAAAALLTTVGSSYASVFEGYLLRD